MARRAKMNKAKAKRAGNTCCPLIHIKCRLTKPTKRAYRDETGWTHEMVPGHKVCDVQLGTRVVRKSAKPDQTGAIVAGLRKKLLDKRCQAVILSEFSERKQGSKGRISR